MDGGSHRVGVCTEIPGLLEEAGVDTGAVLRDVGLPEDALNSPDNQIPYRSVGDLLDACVRRTGDASFGLRLGQLATPQSVGLVGDLMTHAPSLGEAMSDLLSNHQRYVRGGMPYLFRSNEHAYVGFAIYLQNMAGVDQIYDANMAGGCALFRQLAGAKPVEVHLGHKPPDDIAAYRRVFGVRVVFNYEHSALVYALGDLQRPIPGADPAQRRRIEALVREYWQVERPDFAGQVARLLRSRVTDGDVSMAEMVNLLGLQERTISRRLALAGTTFRELVNQTRFSVACEMLELTDLPVTQIALALNYSETSVFSRSFLRWSGGVTPSGWRARATKSAAHPGVAYAPAGGGEATTRAQSCSTLAD